MHVLSTKTTKAQLDEAKKTRLSWLFPSFLSRIIKSIQFRVMLQVIGILGTVDPSCFTALFHFGAQLVSDL